MYLANPTSITTKSLYEYQRQFAICESCFWCATVFQKSDSTSNNNIEALQQQEQQICPICRSKTVSLVPLAKDEGYIT